MAGITPLLTLEWLTGAAEKDRTPRALLKPAIGPIWELRGIKMPAAASSLTTSRPVLLVALLCGLVFAGTLGLWAYHGTAVFFEMVRTGWVACF
jgi:hypothetical protein